ncbi:MAG: putative toxin-antitoxin system toxin component, PIN family [Caldilineaceae bacterium]
MLRIVLDTDVIIAAMRSPSGASAALLRAADQMQIQILVSVAMALEYEAKCTEPEHFRAAGISHADALNFVDAILFLATPVSQRFVWRPQLRDLNDEMILECAINGNASAIITFNLRDFGNAPYQFSIEVLQPGQIMRRLRE